MRLANKLKFRHIVGNEDYGKLFGHRLRHAAYISSKCPRLNVWCNFHVIISMAWCSKQLQTNIFTISTYKLAKKSMQNCIRTFSFFRHKCFWTGTAISLDGKITFWKFWLIWKQLCLCHHLPSLWITIKYKLKKISFGSAIIIFTIAIVVGSVGNIFWISMLEFPERRTLIFAVFFKKFIGKSSSSSDFLNASPQI